MNAAFGTVASGPDGCSPDPEAAVLNGDDGSIPLLIGDRMVQALAVSAASALAPNSSAISPAASVVVRGLAQYMTTGWSPPGEDSARALSTVCAPLNLCDPAVVRNVLLDGAESVGANSIGNATLQALATFIATSTKFVHDSKSAQNGVGPQPSGEALLKRTALASDTVQSAWLEQHSQGLSQAMQDDDVQQLAAAMAPLTQDQLLARSIQSSLPGEVWDPSNSGTDPQPTPEATEDPNDTPTPEPTGSSLPPTPEPTAPTLPPTPAPTGPATPPTPTGPPTPPSPPGSRGPPPSPTPDPNYVLTPEGDKFLDTTWFWVTIVLVCVALLLLFVWLCVCVYAARRPCCGCFKGSEAPACCACCACCSCLGGRGRAEDDNPCFMEMQDVENTPARAGTVGGRPGAKNKYAASANSDEDHPSPQLPTSYNAARIESMETENESGGPGPRPVVASRALSPLQAPADRAVLTPAHGSLPPPAQLAAAAAAYSAGDGALSDTESEEVGRIAMDEASIHSIDFEELYDEYDVDSSNPVSPADPS